MSSSQDMEEVPSTVSDAILLEEQLLKACEVGDVYTVRGLVPDKVDVNGYHGLYSGMAPLHVACAGNQLSVVKALLEMKAEVNIKDAVGWTPLYYACVYGDLEVVRVLLAHGADVNIVSNTGKTALHVMCQIGDDDTLEALLSTDGSPDNAPLVNVNAIDDSEKTLLHYACLNGWVNNAKLLFRRGAEVNVKEEQEKLVWFARMGGHRKMIQYLLQRYPDLE